MSTPTLGKAIILVVEDEPVIRMLAIDLVEEAGFQAMEAADAEEAITILEGRQDIRLVFSDVDMPGISGFQLAATVRDRWPPVEVILTSGRPLPEDAKLPARVEFIAKPFDFKKLTAALRRMAEHPSV